MSAWFVAAVLSTAMSGGDPGQLTTYPPQAAGSAALQPQNAPGATGGQDSDPTILDDVVVDGRRLESRVRDFINQVGAPPQRRGLAKWQKRVCVGVVNMRADVAQPLIDHISRVAEGLGVATGDPGCRPNVIVTFTVDAPALATAMVAENRPLFRASGTGMDRGGVALQAFQDTQSAVRWWHLSIPTIGLTGQRAVRMAGDEEPIYVPAEGLVNRGRPITDLLDRAIIIVDVDKIEGATLDQLGDYLALVALAQVDPDSDTRMYDTVLNLFDAPARVEGLTEWDMSYLSALYSGPLERINTSEQQRGMLRRLRQTSELAGQDASQE